MSCLGGFDTPGRLDRPPAVVGRRVATTESSTALQAKWAIRRTKKASTGSSVNAMLEQVGSWRELDDAIADTSWCRRSGSVRSTVVWRGLARSSYSNMSSLVRLSDDYRQLE